MDASLNQQENKITFRLSREVYDLDAILGASYLFIDRAYVYLDCDPEGNVIASFKGKEELSAKEMEALVGEFQNELLNQTLRVRLAKRNQKIREQIVQLALYPGEGTQENLISPELDKELDEILQEAQESDYGDDPLGIAVPWEEKHGKGRRTPGRESE